MEIYFQGDNHLEEAEDFRISSQDQRAWRVKHPLYDDLIVHPRRLLFDNTKFNVTKITGILLETIVGVFPDAETNAIEEIEERKDTLDEQIAVNYEEQSPTIDGSEANTINDNLSDIETDTIKITVGEQVAELRNSVLAAQSAVLSGIGTTETYIRKAQNTINFPFQVIASVKARLSTFKLSFNRLTQSITTITGRNEKQYYEANGASNISGSCLSAINQIEEFPYTTRTEVDETIESILEDFNNYVAKIDEVQGESSTAVDVYLPDPDSLMQLQDIVNLTVSHLFEVALGSKQEQVLILESDSDPISVAHRLFGIDDENFDEMITINTIVLEELFLLKKGREIIYYV